MPHVSPFRRMARTHALMAAGDVTLAVALAGSLFLSLSPDAARSKVLLYLLISAAPFAVVAPLIGPLIDRLVGGRRLIIQVTALVRALIYLVMIFHIDDLLLFPLVFGALVMQKTYAVSKAAIVPTVVRDDEELVEANSKLGLISGIIGAIAAGPLGLVAKLSPGAALACGAIIFTGALLQAHKLPREAVATRPAAPAEKAELRSAGLVIAASGMAVIRACVGFLFFHVLFWMREDHSLVWLGVAIGAAAFGTMVGNAVAPIARRSVSEEVMFISALFLIAISGIGSAMLGGVVAAIAVAGCVNLSSSVGRLAFDSIVQRDAPDANQGRAFAQFESKFQLSWVLAGVIPVFLSLPGQVGFLVVGLMGSFAAVTYMVSARAVHAGRPVPPTLSARARTSLRKEMIRRRERREATPTDGTDRTESFLPPGPGDRRR